MHSVIVYINIPEKRDNLPQVTARSVLALEARIQEIAKTISGCLFDPSGFLVLPLDTGLTALGPLLEEAKKSGFPLRVLASDSPVRELAILASS